MPVESRPLRIALLTSHAAPGADALLDDPNRGSVYEITAVISSETSFAGAKQFEQAGIPVVLRPFTEDGVPAGMPRNLTSRNEYDGETAHLLEHFRADYVFLCGYNYIVTDALTEQFENRLIALHDGDLTLRDDSGSRRYPGLHAVRDALFAGEKETRASAFFVTRQVGSGPLFLLTRPFPVPQFIHEAIIDGQADLIERYAPIHRDWMVRATWGKMMRRGIEFLAAGTVQVIRELVWVDGVPGPCRMGDAPSICRELKPLIDGGIPASCPLIRD